MFNNDLALFESLFWRPHYNRSVTVSVIMDVDGVPTEPDRIERVNNGKLSGSKCQGKMILFDLSTI